MQCADIRNDNYQIKHGTSTETERREVDTPRRTNVRRHSKHNQEKPPNGREKELRFAAAQLGFGVEHPSFVYGKGNGSLTYGSDCPQYLQSDSTYWKRRRQCQHDGNQVRAMEEMNPRRMSPFLPNDVSAQLTPTFDEEARRNAQAGHEGQEPKYSLQYYPRLLCYQFSGS